MPRRGWTSYPTPSGWYEVILARSPFSGRRVQFVGCHLPRFSSHQRSRFSCQRMQRSEVAKQKVSGIEAALAAVAAAGSTEGPEVTMLKEALQRPRKTARCRSNSPRTRRSSNEPPQAQDVGDPMEEVIVEGKDCPVGGAVSHERIRGSAPKSVRRAAKRRAGVPCVEDVMPTSEQDIHEWMELKNQELRGALDMGDMESVTCSTDMISRGRQEDCHPPIVTTIVGGEHGHVKRSARYGLRGSRVREASHPGPPREVVLAKFEKTQISQSRGSYPDSVF